MKKEIEIFSVKEKLPNNYEDVVMIGDGIVKTGQFINGVFETDDTELYGVMNENDKVDGADVFVVRKWFSASSISKAVSSQDFSKKGETSMFGTEHISQEIDKAVQKAYQKGVEDGVKQVFNERYGDNFLSEDELTAFNAYIDDCMHSIAFGNSDWIEVYEKITNGRMSEKAESRIAFYRDMYDYE